ncbi:MAG: TetR/AcrR family transcriptional regulator [Chloroflexota bacterium]
MTVKSPHSSGATAPRPSARPYRLGQRQATADETHRRIVAAARALLSKPGPEAQSPSLEAVAREAGVARMTVYHQFGSRAGLLEAVFDSLAVEGHLVRLPEAFGRPEPLEALAALVATFARFWASNRTIIRRIRALAAIDDEVGAPLRARDERRRFGLRAIMGRVERAYGRPAPERLDESVDVLHAISSFETFDAIAGRGRSATEVEAILQRLALAVIGLPAGDDPAAVVRLTR